MVDRDFEIPCLRCAMRLLVPRTSEERGGSLNRGEEEICFGKKAELKTRDVVYVKSQSIRCCCILYCIVYVEVQNLKQLLKEERRKIERQEGKFQAQALDR